MKGFKGTDKDGKCRGFQYEADHDYEFDRAELCETGGHFCTAPLDVLAFYPPGNKSRYFAVESADEDASDETRDDNSKRVTKKLHIGAEIGIVGLIKAHFNYVNENVKEYIERGDSEAATAGDRGAATAGYSGAATAGNRGAATAGDYGAATAGDYGAATAGDSGAATAGDYGAATSRGSSCVGKNGSALARGNGVKVRGGLGAVLVIVEENSDDFDIKEWRAFVVDGEKYKPGTWYVLRDGKIAEDE